jgi:hypothetical protein
MDNQVLTAGKRIIDEKFVTLGLTVRLNVRRIPRSLENKMKIENSEYILYKRSAQDS